MSVTPGDDFVPTPRIANRAPGSLFIVIEGIDGAGKSTQVEMLTRRLEQQGRFVVHSREPTDGPWGRKLRESAQRERMTLAEELHALTMDRRSHCENLILPALRDGKVVILDRYFYSTIAYQGCRGGDVSRISRDMIAQFPTPDYVFLIDVPAEVGFERIAKGRGEQPNAFERLDNLRLVRDAFLAMVPLHPNMHVIDGQQSAEAIHSAIMACLPKP